MIRVYYIRKVKDENNGKNANKDTELGRQILRYSLEKDYGIYGADIALSDKGKPYLASHPDIHFSITHTDKAVAVAVSRSPVGIDAETVTDRIFPRIKGRMFTENECEYSGDNPRRFYEIWTRKESYVKLTGDGLGCSVNKFDVLTGEGTGGALFVPVNIPETVACVCSFSREQIEIHELSPGDFGISEK